MVPAEEFSLVLAGLSPCPVLGKGKYGTVYLLDQYTCVKVNLNQENNLTEIQMYRRYRGSPLFPAMYGSGDNFLILELIEGESLKSYLDSRQALDEAWLTGLIKMFEQGQRLGLSLNPAVEHIILTPGGVRLVDLDDIIKFTLAYPRFLLRSLYRYGQKRRFLEFVKKSNQKLYEQWTEGSPPGCNTFSTGFTYNFIES